MVDLIAPRRDENRLGFLRGARDMWRERADLPDFEVLRRELDEALRPPRGEGGMAERLLLDTGVLVEFLRGRPEAIEYPEDVEPESFVSVAEQFSGLRGGTVAGANPPGFHGFARYRGVARLGGLYRRDFGPSHGTGLAGALIAATAEESGADLVTLNRRHYPMVRRVTTPYER